MSHPAQLRPAVVGRAASDRSASLRLLKRRPGVLVLVAIYLVPAALSPSLAPKLIGLALVLTCLLRVVLAMRATVKPSPTP